MAKNLLTSSAMILFMIAGVGCRTYAEKEGLLSMQFEELCEALIQDGAPAGQDRPGSVLDITLPGEEGAAGAESLSEPVAVVDDDTVYSFELRGATLANAVNMIAELAGVNMLLSGDFTETVEVSLPKVNLNQALSWLCSIHGCSITPVDGVFIVSRDDPGERVTRVFELASISASSISENLTQLVGTDGLVIVNEANDIVTVTGTRDVIAKVETFLNSVDCVDRQVLIEAKIIEFSLTDLFELGTALNFNNIQIDDVTSTFITNLLTASDNVEITSAGNNADLSGALRTLAELTEFNVISRPNVVAKNDQEAVIEIVEEIPYIESTITTSGDPSLGVGSSSVEQVEFKEVGLKLKVTPSIMKNGGISLAIDQNVSEQVDTFNGIPIVNRRTVTTQFMGQDGKTILIGGLLKEVYYEQERGVPVLMDIPLLGALFRSTVRQKEKIELVIMITPTIVNPKETSGVPSQYRIDLNPGTPADSAGNAGPAPRSE